MPEATLTTPAEAPSQPAAPAVPAAAVTPVTPAAPAAASPEPSQPANLVSQASQAAPAIPEKFLVKKADGTVDHEATLVKTLGSYSHLEKRFSSGDIPPETEEGYKLDYAAFPEGIKINPEGEKALLKKFHGSGMTNKQVQAVINEYGGIIKQGLDIQKTQESERVSQTLSGVATELKTGWGADFDVNVKAAVRGFNHLADDADKADLAKIGIDAAATYRILMKMAAKVGAGITEDTQVLNADGVPGSDLETLRKSEAYLKEDHPDHAATVARVTMMYQRKYPEK
jgi:hypothetical protein